MRLYHTTTRQHLASIQAQGLLTSLARGKQPLVWVHTRSRIHWAITHVQLRHQVRLEDVVVLEVEVPRSWLTRAWKGLWKCRHDVAPARLVSVTTATEFARSPLDGQ